MARYENMHVLISFLFYERNDVADDFHDDYIVRYLGRYLGVRGIRRVSGFS